MTYILGTIDRTCAMDVDAENEADARRQAVASARYLGWDDEQRWLDPAATTCEALDPLKYGPPSYRLMGGT